MAKALNKIDVFPVGLPSLCTDVGQLIDDNIGKTFKHDVRKKFDAFLDAFDWEANPKGKIQAKEKRKLMAKYTDEVAGAFNSRHMATVQAAAYRTGMCLTIDESDLAKVVPVKYAFFEFKIRSLSYFHLRFPPDFGETLTKQHPLHDSVVEYMPVLLPPTREPPEVTLSARVDTHMEATSSGQGSSITSVTSGSTVDVTLRGPRTRVSASSNHEVSLTIRPRPRVTRNPNSNVGEVAMDEDQSDEENAVYLGEEVPSDDESEHESEVSEEDAETRFVRRTRARLRSCLPGCDCERPRGRLCECEKRGNGMCGLDCQCDRSRCRTSVKDVDESSEESD